MSDDWLAELWLSASYLGTRNGAPVMQSSSNAGVSTLSENLGGICSL